MTVTLQMVGPALGSGDWIGVAPLSCVMPVTSKQQGGAEEEEDEGWPVFKTTQEWNQRSGSPWMVFGCCGRDGNSFHSSCPLRWSWNMRLHQKEPWSISEPSRLPLSAACGSLVLFLGTGRCCGPGGMLPTMGHLLEQVSPRV